jgi:Polyketide cyclase / dehydrase and lipid transport
MTSARRSATIHGMSHHVIEASAHSTASRDAVWALVADIGTYQQWGTWSSTTLESPGDGDPQGVGAIRRLRQFPVTSRERVTEIVPAERLGYELVSGLPFDNYRAHVTLADAAGGGTDITWRAEFDVSARVRGGFWRRALERFYPDLVQRLADAPGKES